MNVKCILGTSAYRGTGIFVYAKKIAYVKLHTKVGMVYSVYKKLKTVRILAEHTVVFYHSFDSFFSSVFGYFTTSISDFAYNVDEA